MFKYLLPLSLACALSAAALAAIDLSEFQGSFNGWSQQWHIDEDGKHVTPGQVKLDSSLGYLDSHSLHFDMGNGFGDDGTLWIEKGYTLPATRTSIDLSFRLYNLAQSDVNQFEVKAYIGEANPQVQSDFTLIGLTDRIAGWDAFSFSRTLSSTASQVWVALGIRVAWEGHHDHWIDHVRVVTTQRNFGLFPREPINSPVPEPASVALLAISVIAATRRHARRDSD